MGDLVDDGEEEPLEDLTLLAGSPSFPSCSSGPPSDPPVPEWAQQEVRFHPRSSGLLESWFPLSDQAGVSSHLMESMR